MSKQNIILISLGVIIAAVVCGVWFFAPKSPLSVENIRPVCDPATTDCSKFTPDGTPFVRPPEPVSPATTTQVGQIDEHLFVNNTLKEVNFCGTSYRVKQVLIDGVDVVQRIAELVTESQRDYVKEVCTRIEGLRVGGWLRLDENEIGITKIENDFNSVDKIYLMSLVSPTGNLQSIGDFKVDVTTKDMFIVLQGFADSSSKVIGKLK